MKKILTAICLLALCAFGFAQSNYSTLYEQAKKYESEGRLISALGTYFDAIEAEPSAKAQDAINSLEKISSIIEAGVFKRGGNVSDSDIYQAWAALCADYQLYFIEHSPYAFGISLPVKSDVDNGSKTCSYTFTLRAFYSDKYKFINKVLKTGYDKIKTSDWKDVWKDILSYECYTVSFKIVDSENKNIFSSENASVKRGKTRNVFDYKFTKADSKKMQLIEEGNFSIVPTKVYLKTTDFGQGELELKNVRFGTFVSIYKNVNPLIAVKALPFIKLVKVDGGTFAMGSKDFDESEEPIHSVTVDSFEMLATEVSDEFYATVMQEKVYGKFPKAVSWFDAVKFCNELSRIYGYIPCYDIKPSMVEGIDDVFLVKNANGFRLPTEAEWEYAARGGKNQNPYLFSGSSKIADVAWYKPNSSKMEEVAGKKPNSLGFYDMSGNAAEWCYDLYQDYSSEAQSNPTGADPETTRVLRYVVRGGSFRDGEDACRVTARKAETPVALEGFRIVRQIPKK